MAQVEIVAWGNKHGELPFAPDLVFVLTGLRNPYRMKGLRYITGRDPQVQKDVWDSPYAKSRYQMMKGRVKELLKYRKLTSVVFMCHGGRHRSVVFALRLGEELMAEGHVVNVDTPFAKEENGD